ncbi:MAG: 16S rRNA (adenine(1518)-N(6)/adenine(1519)-N(6))-dimethyltransferase RsmA [Pseudomonadota bacterium]
MSKIEHRAKKRFGQNFLHDENVVQKIIHAINPQADDHLVEIGPGLGALTSPLLNLNIKLDVIEIDRELIIQLRNKFAPKENFIIHEHDALKFDYASISANKIRVIGNLPYNISTPLLFNLLGYSKNIQDLTFMLQKEVIDRICAVPGNKQYGRLTVMLQYHCAVEKLFIVKSGAFNPAPKVDSAVVKLVPKTTADKEVKDPVLFSALVSDAFSQRRKTLRNSLGNFLTEEQIKELDINPTLRPEMLTVNEFVSLANLASQYRE